MLLIDSEVISSKHVEYIFVFSYCSWGSQGKNAEAVRHSFLQWTKFVITLHHDPPSVLGGPTWHGSSVQFSSVTQLCLILCDPMDSSMPGFPVHHQLPELIQTHVHRVSDAIQPSHPLLSPSPSAFNLSQHQGLFQ